MRAKAPAAFPATLCTFRVLDTASAFRVPSEGSAYFVLRVLCDDEAV